MRPKAWALWLLALSALLSLSVGMAACRPNGAPGAGLPPRPEYNSFSGATEFVLGENRFPFALSSLAGEPLRGAEVTVDFFALNGAEREFRSSHEARYREAEGVTPHLHDDGLVHEHAEVRGQYVVDAADFQTAGVWAARFSIVTGAGERPTAGELAFNVLPKPSAPGVGEPAPPTRTLTVDDVANVAEIDSHVPPTNMHRLSIADAIELRRPFVVVWSAPMFCASRICGPVLDQVIAVQGGYSERVNFIHVEPWDLNVARTEGRLVPTPAFTEWRLPSEPWVFLVDQSGRVAARFEGLVTREELEEALEELLAGP